MDFNKIALFEEKVKRIEKNVYMFIDNAFSNIDLDKITPDLHYQGLIKLIEILNKDSK